MQDAGIRSCFKLIDRRVQMIGTELQVPRCQDQIRYSDSKKKEDHTDASAGITQTDDRS